MSKIGLKWGVRNQKLLVSRDETEHLRTEQIV